MGRHSRNPLSSGGGRQNSAYVRFLESFPDGSVLSDSFGHEWVRFNGRWRTADHSFAPDHSDEFTSDEIVEFWPFNLVEEQPEPDPDDGLFDSLFGGGSGETVAPESSVEPEAVEQPSFTPEVDSNSEVEQVENFARTEPEEPSEKTPVDDDDFFDKPTAVHVNPISKAESPVNERAASLLPPLRRRSDRHKKIANPLDTEPELMTEPTPEPFIDETTGEDVDLTPVHVESVEDTPEAELPVSDSFYEESDPIEELVAEPSNDDEDDDDPLYEGLFADKSPVEDSSIFERVDEDSTEDTVESLRTVDEVDLVSDDDGVRTFEPKSLVSPEKVEPEGKPARIFPSFDEAVFGESEPKPETGEVELPKRRDVQKKNRRKPFVIGGVAAAALLLGGGGVGGYAWYNSTLTSVPTAAASSISADNADPCLAFVDAGLECVMTTQNSDTDENGAFISQSVAAGEKVKKGTKVELVYSVGPKSGTMEDLAGKSLQDVKDWLQKRNLIVGAITEDDSATIESGRVVKLSLNPGDTYTNGQTVDIIVSAGGISAPDWSGKDKAAIEASAKELGIEVSFAEQEAEGAPGLFISQSPAAGEQVVGNKMTVTISKSATSTSLKMPDVVGKSKDEAQTELMTAGFTRITTVVVKNSEVSEEKVTQTVPEANSDSKSDENVVVIVSQPEN